MIKDVENGRLNNTRTMSHGFINMHQMVNHHDHLLKDGNEPCKDCRSCSGRKRNPVRLWEVCGRPAALPKIPERNGLRLELS